MTRQKQSRRKELPGFTLIEILVVVAIIALLISVLLPSLARAREQARSAACAMNLSQICRAENLYQTANRGWIPGSILTTGYSLAAASPTKWNPLLGAIKHTRFAVTVFDYATPLRAVMNGELSIPRPGTTPASDGLWKNLWLGSTAGVFNCPSNNYIYPVLSDPGGFPQIQSISYLTMWTIMRGGSKVFDEWKTSKYGGLSSSYTNAGQASSWEITPPADWVPRHDRLGQESMKVFLADGTRWYNPTPPEKFNYDTTPTAAKGAFSGNPPCLRKVDESIPGPEYRNGRERSFRHAGKDQMNAGFFDGHVEALKVDYRGQPFSSTGRYAGKAVQAKYYYPKGSIVNDPDKLHYNNIPAGTILP